MNREDKHICFVGNMLGRNPGYITTQGQILADLFEADGYRVTSASSKLNKGARLADIIGTLVRGRSEFDAVMLEVYSGPNFVVANTVAAVCSLLKLPLIMVLHGGNLPEFVSDHPLWTRFALSRADAIAAPSGFLADAAGRLGYTVEVIPNVVDVAAYPFRKRKKIEPLLFWMRSFHPLYEPRMALEVVAELKKRGRPAKLVMAGKDKGLEASLKRIAGAMGISESVRFAGFLDHEAKIAEFDSADVYINTNAVDNMPVSIVEAMAMGVPVVSTDAGGIPYLIRHGENGLLVPTGDSDAMADSIEELLNEPQLVAKISEKGRARAQSSAWPEVKIKWLALVDRVIAKRREKVASASLRAGEGSSEEADSSI